MSDFIGNRAMQELVKVIQDIQDALTENGVQLELDLPRICVIGGQSVGKSSVLENIIGREFLPRGTDIVTRCPIIIKCQRNDDEYVTFDKDSDQEFYYFEDVCTEIRRQTDKLCGNGKNISSTPISLTIRSPSVLNLLLIDLPGITRAAVPGQPQDIEQQTLNLAKNYVSPPNVIILAVSAANVDLANSDAMKIAQEVDPQGERTIGVLTKVDRLEVEISARNILENKIIPLRLGYVAVRNKTPAEPQEMDIKELREKEASFFANHRHYSDLSKRLGVPFLQKLMNEELIKHIQKNLPELRSKLTTKVKTANQELAGYEDESDPELVVMKYLNKFEDHVRRDLDGYTTNVSTAELCGGAKINELFHKDFHQILLKKKDKFPCTREEIELIIKNIRAKRNGIFTPDQVHDVLIGKLMQNYQEPVFQCIELATKELQKCIDEASETLQLYPQLQTSVRNLIDDHLITQEQRTKDYLETYISIEAAFINMNCPAVERELNNMGIPGSDIIHVRQGNTVVPTVLPAFADKKFNVQSNMGDQTRMDVAKVEKTVTAYMNAVKNKIVDFVSKCVMHFLLNSTQKYIQKVLAYHLRKEHPDMKELLITDEDRKERMSWLQKSCEAAEKALKIINTFERRHGTSIYQSCRKRKHSFDQDSNTLASDS